MGDRCFVCGCKVPRNSGFGISRSEVVNPPEGTPVRFLVCNEDYQRLIEDTKIHPNTGAANQR